MKNFKKLLSNQKGMSLIEITAAAAISVIISMAVVKTNQIGQKGMTKVSTDLDLKMWQQQRLIQTLGEPGACSNTFPGHDIRASLTVEYIRDTQNIVVYTAGDDIEGGAWTIVSMAIVGVPAADISPAVNKYTTNFEINMRRKNSQSFGARDKKIFVPIVVVRASDPSYELVSCSAGSAGADGLWSQELANGGYIHSAGEYVIIGSNGSTPAAPFQIDINSGLEWPGDIQDDVYPAMRINTSGDAIVFGPGAGSGALYQSRTYDNYATGNCLVMGHGDTGNIVSKIESCGAGVRLNSYRSDVVGANATVLGGSSAYANGQFSIATGGKTKALGEYSFAQGYYTTASGDNSASFGSGGLVSGSNAFGAGNNAHAYGDGSISLGMNTLARAKASIALGYNAIADNETSIAIGIRARSVHGSSMVLAGSGSVIYSTDAQQFTAAFTNGYKFITGSNNYPSTATGDDETERRSVFIDSTGNMGLGKDLQFTTGSEFSSGNKPKLFVKGDAQVNGDFAVYAEDGSDRYSLKTYEGTTTKFADGKSILWGGGDQTWSGLGSYDDNWQSIGLSLMPTRGGVSGHLSTFGLNMTYNDGDNRWKHHSDGVNSGSSGLLMEYGAGSYVGLYVRETNDGVTSEDASSMKSQMRLKVTATQIQAYVQMKTNFADTVTSDKRLKKDFKIIANPLEKLQKLNGYYYTWKATDELDENIASLDGYKERKERADIGLIAQEVEAVLPELVDTDKEEANIKSVNYSQLIAVVIEGVKDLANQVSDIVKDLFSLTEQVSSLENRVEKLEDDNRIMREQLCDLHPKLNSCLSR